MVELDASKQHQLRSVFLTLKRCVCGNSIILPVGEKFLLIAGLIPIILISSYSTCYFVSCVVIVLEEYDALLNPYFSHFSLISLNLIVLIIGNERETELVHGQK